MARSTTKNRRRAAEKQAAEALKARAEYLRHRKAMVHRRNLLLTLGPILALVVAWLGYGFFREAYWEPRQPVARVEGQAITASDYGKRVQYARRQMLGNLSNILGMISASDSSFITEYANTQRTNLPQTTLDQMIDEVLIRKEAERRDLTVTDEEVAERIRKDLIETLEGPSATAEEGEEGAAEGVATQDDAAEPVDAAADEAAADPDAEPTAAIETSDEEIERAFDRLIQPMLVEAGMTRADYEKLIRAQLYSEKLSEALGEEVPATAKQVEADYLLFSTDQDAEAALAVLADGASWDEAVARFEEPAEADASDGVETDAGDASAAADTTEGEAAATADAQPTEEPTLAPTDEPTATATRAATMTAAATASSAGAVTETASTETAPDATAAPDGDGAAGDAEGAEAAASDEPVYAVEVGERRWYTADALVERLALTQADADAVLLLTQGETSQGLTGSRGTYILLVNAVEADRALEDADLQALKDGALEKWLSGQRTAMSGEISRFPLTGLVPAEEAWFTAPYEQLVGGVSSQVPLQLPTVAPAVDITIPPAGADGAVDPGSAPPAGDAPVDEDGG